MKRAHRLILIALLLGGFGAVAHAQDQDTPPTLTVAYTQNGDLWLWREGASRAQRIAEGEVHQPLLSPGGARVIFWQGAGQDVALWVVEAGGENAHMPVSADVLRDDEGQYTINRVVWRGDEALYFDTIFTPHDSFYGEPSDDLWRVDLVTGGMTQLLAPRAGGKFYIAPDGAHIAFSTPGRYREQAEQATVSVVDALGAGRVDAFAYPAVSTASEYHFYATPHWLPDSSAFRVAIPDPDAVYAFENLPPVALWEVSASSAAQQIGEVAADYFSVLFNESFWSPGGAHIAYTGRVGTLEDNRMALCMAAADGSDPVCFAEGEIGTLTPLGWTPGDVFVYRQDDPGGAETAATMWMVAPGGTPQPFPGEPVYTLAWVDAETYVYVTTLAGTAYLKYARLGAAPETIATAEGAWLEFSAVLAP